MHTVGAFEAKTHFSSLLEQVAKGEHVTITKHGHPVAKLVPAKSLDRVNLKKTIEELKAFNKLQTLGNIDWKVLRDEGRK